MIIQLPQALLANASAPHALELELWEHHTCLFSHPVLVVPSHMASVAHELKRWWAEVHDALQQQQRLLEQLQPRQRGEVAQQKQEVFEGMFTYLQDLADYLRFVDAEGRGLQPLPGQVRARCVVGALAKRDLQIQAHVLNWAFAAACKL